MSNLESKHRTNVNKGIIYSFFSITIPSLFVLSTDLILRTLFVDLAAIPWWTIFPSIICNIISSRVLIYLSKKHAKVDSYIRIHTFIYLPTLALLYFIQSESPTFLVYLILLYLMQWLILFTIFNKFRDYFNFIKFVKQKSPEKSNHIFIENGMMIQDAHKSLKKLNSFIRLIHYILFFFVSTLILSNVPLSTITLSVCLSSIFCGIAFSLALSVSLDEYNFIVGGFSINKPMKQKRFTYILLLLIIALLLMLIGTQYSRFFTPEDILDFLRWLFPEKKIPIATSDYIEPSFGTKKPIEIIPEEFNTTPLFNLSAVLDFIGMILIPILIIGFLLFIFKPLMEQGLKQLLKGKNPLKTFKNSLKLFFHSLKQNIKAIIQYISRIFHPLKKSGKINSINFPSGFIKREETKSYQKRRQTNRVIKIFIKLIQWGQRQNIFFHPSFAPNEYLDMIIVKNPHLKNSLKKVGHVFEEALFSDHIIEGKIIKDYINQIKEIIK